MQTALVADAAADRKFGVRRLVGALAGGASPPSRDKFYKGAYFNQRRSAAYQGADKAAHSKETTHT